MTADTRAITQDWTEPGVYPVAPGVHRVPLPLPTDGLRAVNVYVLEADDGLVLIDSGWALQQARDALDIGAGHPRRRARRRAVVPGHPRAPGPLHAGCRGAPGVRHHGGPRARRAGGHRGAAGGRHPPVRAAAGRACGQRGGHRARAARRAGKGGAGRRRRTGRPRTSGSPPSRRSASAPAPCACSPHPATPRATLCSPTPPAACCSPATTCCRTSPRRSGSSRCGPRTRSRDYLQSLRLVRGLPDMRLLPAHGPVTESAHARIDALLAHHDGRLDRCAAAVAAGAATALRGGPRAAVDPPGPAARRA